MPITQSLVLLAAGSAAAVFPSPGAGISLSGAQAVFRQALQISDRDGGKLWGLRLYGPMVLVDPNDLQAVANRADGTGVLKRQAGAFVGTLPTSVTVANTPIEWAGNRWTELLWPLQAKSDASSKVGDDWRAVLLAHEMFHRIQPRLGLTRPEADNGHLDTLEGRYLLQLEWRALARALNASSQRARRKSVADAVLFRQERYRRFPQAAVNEGDLEVAEGVPEYTGVRLGLTSAKARVRYALYDLSAFVDAPTFVRSFAYATGPAYGLLLDQADPRWKAELRRGRRLDQLLASAFRVSAMHDDALVARERDYDPGGRLKAAEVARQQAKQAQLAQYRSALVAGPVLRMSLSHANYGFNPQTLQPLGDSGTVFPTLSVKAEWGSLNVETGGALMNKDRTQVAVSVSGWDPATTSGHGWRVVLNPGWSIRRGTRPGDFEIGH